MSLCRFFGSIPWILRTAGLLLAAALLAAPASGVTMATDSAEYLLIGRGSQGVVGTVTAVSNWELGANSESVPSSDLIGSVPALPGNAATVFVGIGGEGDTALTDTNGSFAFSNLEIYGDMGVDCAGTCTQAASNTNFTGTGGALSTSNGINLGVNLSGVTGEFSALESEIPALSADITLDFSSDGVWDTDLTINLVAGLTVIDIDTGGNDLSLTNENLLFQGPSGAFAIVRVPDDANFVVNQSNILIGNGGIEENNVLFTSFKDDSNAHFGFNDTVLNGVAFWDFSDEGEITLGNAQGCTQLNASKINLSDVRLNNCAAVIPEPATGSLLVLGLAGLAAGTSLRRRNLRGLSRP